jgi:hypothetical protein
MRRRRLERRGLGLDRLALILLYTEPLSRELL